MTSIEINIAIAEACGWTDISQYTQAVDGWYGYEPENGPHSQVPNYCNDLNAMHEAEMTLTADQFEQYRWILWDICKQFRVKDWYRCYLSSTARQRAEAFLKTLGKWEE